MPRIRHGTIGKPAHYLHPLKQILREWHWLMAGLGIEAIRGRGMFFFYFNKLGWPGSILVSIVLTLLLVLAFRLISG